MTSFLTCVKISLTLYALAHPETLPRVVGWKDSLSRPSAQAVTSTSHRARPKSPSAHSGRPLCTDSSSGRDPGSLSLSEAAWWWEWGGGGGCVAAEGQGPVATGVPGCKQDTGQRADTTTQERHGHHSEDRHEPGGDAYREHLPHLHLGSHPAKSTRH